MIFEPKVQTCIFDHSWEVGGRADRRRLSDTRNGPATPEDHFAAEQRLAHSSSQDRSAEVAQLKAEMRDLDEQREAQYFPQYLQLLQADEAKEDVWSGQRVEEHMERVEEHVGEVRKEMKKEMQEVKAMLVTAQVERAEEQQMKQEMQEMKVMLAQQQAMLAQLLDQQQAGAA